MKLTKIDHLNNFNVDKMKCLHYQQISIIPLLISSRAVTHFNSAGYMEQNLYLYKYNMANYMVAYFGLAQTSKYCQSEINTIIFAN